MLLGTLIRENKVLEINKNWNREYLEQQKMEEKKIKAF